MSIFCCQLCSCRLTRWMGTLIEHAKQLFCKLFCKTNEHRNARGKTSANIYGTLPANPTRVLINLTPEFHYSVRESIFHRWKREPVEWESVHLASTRFNRIDSLLSLSLFHFLFVFIYFILFLFLLYLSPFSSLSNQNEPWVHIEKWG